MTELKLVATLIKSLILWIVLLIPRVVVYILGALEASFKILKETVKTLTREIKKSVLNQ